MQEKLRLKIYQKHTRRMGKTMRRIEGRYTALHPTTTFSCSTIYPPYEDRGTTRKRIEGRPGGG